MNFSDNLKQIRKEHNLSQEQIAEQLGVSRQSVSKWESGQAYPEMDKMIQLCQMFNLNIDDLLNQDIKEVNSNKQVKSNVNKFVDDFLAYMTKTVDMLGSMSFKEKMKCIIEQIFNIIFIGIILSLIGLIGGIACSYLFTFLPINIYYKVLYVIGAIYILFSLFLGIVILLHIFKIRYLDYYIIVKNSMKKEEKQENLNDVEKIVVEKKIEKLIIREPEHSSYRFISSVIKGLIYMIKLLAGFIGCIGCVILVCLTISLVLSFLIIKTGLLFIGIFIGLISLITFNLLVLLCLYNFIVDKKIDKNKVGGIGLISIVMCGIGIGISLIGITQFDIINDPDSDSYVEKIIEIDMEDEMFIYEANTEYIVSDIENVKIVVKHSPPICCKIRILW